MNKSEYALLLLDERWNEVRKRILKRDQYCCKLCKKSNTRLSVHHRIYLKDAMPWDVPDRFLVALCDKCHTKEHKDKTIESFVRNKIPTRVNNPNKGRKKSKSMIWVEGKGLVPAP